MSFIDASALRRSPLGSCNKCSDESARFVPQTKISYTSSISTQCFEQIARKINRNAVNFSKSTLYYALHRLQKVRVQGDTIYPTVAQCPGETHLKKGQRYLSTYLIYLSSQTSRISSSAELSVVVRRLNLKPGKRYYPKYRSVLKHRWKEFRAYGWSQEETLPS